MTYVPVARHFDFMPGRSVAMAVALCLNLAVVVMAIRPDTPFTVPAPPPPALLATLLQNPPPAPALPEPPTVRVVNHVQTPQVPLAITPSIAVKTTVLPQIAPVRLVPAATHAVPQAAVAPGNHDATIAYETATPPAYPAQALRNGAQGTVLLKVLVDTHGVPVQVKVQHSSGWRTLDVAARTHVLAAWRFHPAIHDGHAIEAWVLVPVRFDLDNR